MFQYLALLISSTFSHLSIHNPFPISAKYRSTVRSARVGITSQDKLITFTHFSYVSWLKPPSYKAFDRYCLTSPLLFSNVTDQNKLTWTQVHKHLLKVQMTIRRSRTSWHTSSTISDCYWCHTFAKYLRSIL